MGAFLFGKYRISNSNILPFHCIIKTASKKSGVETSTMEKMLLSTILEYSAKSGKFMLAGGFRLWEKTKLEQAIILH